MFPLLGDHLLSISERRPSLGIWGVSEYQEEPDEVFQREGKTPDTQGGLHLPAGLGIPLEVAGEREDWASLPP